MGSFNKVYVRPASFWVFETQPATSLRVGKSVVGA